MLDNDKKLIVFQAQTRNVQELQATWRHLKRSLHRDLVAGNLTSAAALTRLLALTYCAWTETLFSKLIHTPYGFDCQEIESIKSLAKNNIVLGWGRCVELALVHVVSSSVSDISSAKKALNDLVKTYIQEPSQLRNKIAHGQIVVALNSKNDDINSKLTGEISSLDIVKLDRLRAGATGLANMIEMLIESPEKTGMKNFQKVSKEIVADLNAMSSFTMIAKIALLKTKTSRSPRNIAGVVISED
ncbi:MAG: hypothetical protein H7Z39_07560 [Burkholderiaceae bacterium]|nr:hypothetical protein [Burkholderiaceae bacterium]